MPTAEQRKENKERVIQATLWCFENIGIEKTTRTAVEKRAGVTGRSIQRYFGSIDNLIVEAMNTYLQNYTDLLYSEFQKNNDPKSSGLEQLKTFFRTHLIFYEQSMNSSLLAHEIELYFVRNGLSFQCVNPKVYDSAAKKSIIRELLLKGIADGSVNSTVDFDALCAYLYITFPGMILRISMVSHDDYFLNDKITPTSIMEEYIRSLEALVQL